MNLLFVDVESGGLDCKKHSLLSVGACVMDLDTGQVIDSFENLVKLPKIEDYVVNTKALEINGLTVEQCFKEGIPPAEIAAKLIDLWINHGCTAYGNQNIDFDAGFLAVHLFGREPHEFGQVLGCYRKMDSTSLIIALQGHADGPSGQTLKKTVAALGIDTKEFSGKFHSALFDAVCAGKICWKIRSMLKKVEA